MLQRKISRFKKLKATVEKCPAISIRKAVLGSPQFSRSVMSVSLRSHGLQHARLPCKSPTPGPYSNLCPSSHWCHPAISSSVILFSSRLQSFPASGSFLVSQFFASGGQSIRSFSFTISPSNEYSRLDSNIPIFQWIFTTTIDWLDFLAVQGTLKSLLQHHSSKASILWRSAFFTVQLSNPYTTTVWIWLWSSQTIALTRQTFVGKVMSLLFNTLSWS